MFLQEIIVSQTTLVKANRHRAWKTSLESVNTNFLTILIFSSHSKKNKLLFFFILELIIYNHRKFYFKSLLLFIPPLYFLRKISIRKWYSAMKTKVPTNVFTVSGYDFFLCVKSHSHKHLCEGTYKYENWNCHSCHIISTVFVFPFFFLFDFFWRTHILYFPNHKFRKRKNIKFIIVILKKLKSAYRCVYDVWEEKLFFKWHIFGREKKKIFL